VQRETQEKRLRAEGTQYRLRLAFEGAREEQAIRHAKALEDLEREGSKLRAEALQAEQAMAVIQNEHLALQTKLDNVRRESKLIEEQVALGKQREGHLDSLVRTLAGKVEGERQRQEALEVQQYEQSVKMATLSEDSDQVLAFMEEFIKRHTGGAKPRDNTLFRELSDGDREAVNEILKSLGIQYKEVF